MFRLPNDIPPPSNNFTLEEEVLARTLYGEAAGESRQGREAVANVIMNRVRLDLHNDGKPDWWGEGVVEICLKPWQFTCWSDHNRARILRATNKDAIFRQCLEIAHLACTGRLADTTGGAVQYLNVPLTKKLYGALPNWVERMRQTVVVGRHSFFVL